jgi:hypothetical protein
MRAKFWATSNKDYRGRDLPSVFGPEQKGFPELAPAKKWLESIRHGGVIDQWSDAKRKYVRVETIGPAKAAAK